VAIADAAPPATKNVAEDPVATLVAAAALGDIVPKLRPGSEPLLAAPPSPDEQEIVNVWNGGKGDFGIQVGAFAKEVAAKKAADGAAEAIPELLGEARIVVDTQKTGNGGTLYRARVIGLSRDAAEQACRDLARHRTDCLVLKTGSNLAMGG
jgi:D-alanyl-D-alanine carboxypeptidase